MNEALICDIGERSVTCISSP